MNQIDLTEKEQQIAQLLLDYMKKHPDAKHTAEGIARWWILQQKLEDEVEVIKKVINYLSEVGLLEKVIIPKGNEYYKFHYEKLNNDTNFYM